MKTLSEFSKEYKPVASNQYYTELSEQDRERCKSLLLSSYFEYIQKADGILSEEDYTILSESGMFDDLTKPALLPVIRGVGLRRVRSIIASSCIVIMFAGLIGVLLYVLGLVLYFVGGLSLVGIEIFADGSALGFIGAAAAVIITLGMFATLVKAILGK